MSDVLSNCVRVADARIATVLRTHLNEVTVGVAVHADVATAGFESECRQDARTVAITRGRVQDFELATDN